jgi:hypothetical protein
MRQSSATTLTIMMITIIIKISIIHNVFHQSWIDVDTCETLSLLLALQWAQNLHLTNVDFKLDSTNVVTEIHDKDDDNSKYGVVVIDCQRIHNSIFTNSCVEFTRRLVNEVAHVLAMAATSLASFHIFIDKFTCIRTIIINETS